MVQGDAVPDAGKGVAREIEVRNGVEDKMGAVAAQCGKRGGSVDGQLVKAHAGHRLVHQLGSIPRGKQDLCKRFAIAVGDGAAAVNKIRDKLLLQRRALR